MLNAVTRRIALGLAAATFVGGAALVTAPAATAATTARTTTTAPQPVAPDKAITKKPTIVTSGPQHEAIPEATSNISSKVCTTTMDAPSVVHTNTVVLITTTCPSSVVDLTTVSYYGATAKATKTLYAVRHHALNGFISITFSTQFPKKGQWVYAFVSVTRGTQSTTPLLPDSMQVLTVS